MKDFYHIFVLVPPDVWLCSVVLETTDHDKLQLADRELK